jgi:hypothetical protein
MAKAREWVGKSVVEIVRKGLLRYETHIEVEFGENTDSNPIYLPTLPAGGVERVLVPAKAGSLTNSRE